MLYVINFKTYENGTGSKAKDLAKTIKKVSQEKGEKIIAAVQPTDIQKVSKIVTTFSQHVDPIDFGSNTGHILPEAVKQSGAIGTLINHSEKRVPLEEVEFLIEKCKKLGLKTIVCCRNPEECEKISDMNPDYIAIEPPELIGTGRSVSQENPEIITKSKEVSEVPLLCGAGISKKEDVERAKELGAEGILVASAVVKSDKPENVLKDLVI